MRRPPTRVLLPGLVVGVALLLAGASAAAGAEQNRLREARERLEEIRDEIDSVEDVQSERRSALADAEERVAEVVEAVHAAEMAVQRQEEAVRGARERLGNLEDAADAHRRSLAERAAEMYRQGTGVPMSAMLASEDADDLVRRSGYLKIVQQADLAGFEKVEADEVALDAQRDVLEAEEESLREALEEQQAILAEARKLRDERALAVADVEEKLSDLESQERHLESESRELAAMARRASREAEAQAAAQQTSGASGNGGGPAPSGDSSSAGFQWPASGPVTSEYGMRWGRMHEGIDIGGGQGAAIVAARAGTVSHAGRMGGYGNMVLVEHGGGITTAYAHLSSIEASAGQSVSQGQRLGGMGCTGSCTGTHLHFEVRVNGSAQNPRGYLP